jgi:hypothetical protein
LQTVFFKTNNHETTYLINCNLVDFYCWKHFQDFLSLSAKANLNHRHVLGNQPFFLHFPQHKQISA